MRRKIIRGLLDQLICVGSTPLPDVSFFGSAIRILSHCSSKGKVKTILLEFSSVALLVLADFMAKRPSDFKTSGS